VARDGKALRFYLNYSGVPQSFSSQRPVAGGERLTLAPWDLAVIRE
jgi:hypothetical protein